MAHHALMTSNKDCVRPQWRFPFELELQFLLPGNSGSILPLDTMLKALTSVIYFFELSGKGSPTLAKPFFYWVNLDITKSKGFVYILWTMSIISYFHSPGPFSCLLRNKNGQSSIPWAMPTRNHPECLVVSITLLGSPSNKISLFLIILPQMYLEHSFKLNLIFLFPVHISNFPRPLG